MRGGLGFGDLWQVLSREHKLKVAGMSRVLGRCRRKRWVTGQSLNELEFVLDVPFSNGYNR